jgi:hypothetical protein
MPWPGSAMSGNVTEMPGMKISLNAAMRARDVSQPTAVDEMAAAQPGTDSRTQAGSLPSDRPEQSRRPEQNRRLPRARGRPRPRYGSAGSSPDSS